jgi:glycolate oxidase iron-sulfur subunit
MLRCIRCAACLTSCPTYVISHKEEEGPRGRIAIMRAIVEGHLDFTPDAVEHVGNCLLCDACSHVCPSGVEMEPLGIAFREELRRHGGHPERRAKGPLWRRGLGILRPLRFARGQALLRMTVERFAYGWLFGDLGYFRAVARLLRFYQRSGLRWLARHLGILRLLGLRDAERLLPDIPKRFLIPKDQAIGAGEPAQVFAGCIMSTAFGPTTERTAALAAVFGARASFPAGQVCCGALQLHAGEVERARELACANLESFGGDAPIVVNAAGCGAMLKHYGQLLPEEPRAQAFSARVKDVAEFLAEREPSRAPREIRRTVAVQDACHLLHAQRISAAPRKLLRAIPGLELREMAEAGICCGSAGIYNVTHREFGAELQRRKCANIAATGAETVVTGNPGCLLQIQAGLPSGIEAQHIVDVLAEAYLPQCHPEQSEGSVPAATEADPSPPGSG